MFVALNKNGKRIYAEDASKEEQYYCPVCKGKLIVRKGEIKACHFAHKENQCKDNWHYDMSEWHRWMQSFFPKESQEIVVENNGKIHRADVLIKHSKTVIEMQHSPISIKEFDERTEFFMNLGYRVAWIFDLRSYYENNNLFYDEDRMDLLIWKHPLKTFMNSPLLNQNNDKFSLWFMMDIYDDLISIQRVIWAINGSGMYSFNRFIVSEKSIILNDENSKYPFNEDELFLTYWQIKNEKEKLFLLELQKLKKSNISYEIKYIGQKGRSRDCYICPKSQKFGLSRYGEYSCQYCKHCYMIAEKMNNNKKMFAIYCCFPSIVNKEDIMNHPGYEFECKRIFEI